MPTPADATLAERAGYLYRHLVLLRRLFRGVDEEESLDPAAREGPDGLTLLAAVRDVLDDLAGQAKVLTSVPFPLREWRPGDTADDERWRALTEIERRQVLSLVGGYENLVAWAEAHTADGQRPAARGDDSTSADFLDTVRRAREQTDPAEFLRLERTRLAQFRRDMRFLERRRAADEEPSGEPPTDARRTARSDARD